MSFTARVENKVLPRDISLSLDVKRYRYLSFLIRSCAYIKGKSRAIRTIVLLWCFVNPNNPGACAYVCQGLISKNSECLM